MKDGISCAGVPCHHRLAPNLDRGDLDSAYIGPTCPSTIPSYPLDHPNHPIGHFTNPIHPLGEHFCHHDRMQKYTTMKHLFWLLLNLDCAYNGLRCPPDQESMIAHCVDDPDAPAQRSASIDFWCRWFHCCCCILAQHCQCENYNKGKYECFLWMISRHEEKKMIAFLKMQKAYQGGHPIVRFWRTFIGIVHYKIIIV